MVNGSLSPDLDNPMNNTSTFWPFPMSEREDPDLGQEAPLDGAEEPHFSEAGGGGPEAGGGSSDSRALLPLPFVVAEAPRAMPGVNSQTAGQRGGLGWTLPWVAGIAAVAIVGAGAWI